MKLLLLILAVVLSARAAAAELAMPKVFGDHMVLQAEKPARIWGQASPGARVTAAFAGQAAKDFADEQGNWSLALPAMKASAEGAELSISDGQHTLQFSDVLVGEVWFASGQSNMNWPMGKCDLEKVAIRAADYPTIRFFQAATVADSSPQTDAEGQWIVCTPETVGDFSAVGFSFAKKLHEELGVPVAIIKSAWGGKPIEAFVRREALASIPEGKKLLGKFDTEVAAYDEEAALERYNNVILKRYEDRLAQWNTRPESERKGRPAPGKPPMPPEPARDSTRPTTIWNGMIHPFVGYSIRGVIWYQGESNTGNVEQASDYGALFALTIQDWRKQWGDDFRFLWVQLANHKRPVAEPGTNDPWAIVQDQQRLCLALPSTGMAVANDVGAADNIHPLNKRDVGERLARWALADEYGQAIVKCGPLYEGHTLSAGTVTVKFAHRGKRLTSRDGEALQGFEIQDHDGTWHWAEAAIKGDAVIISHPAVTRAAAARYAWAANPEGANLVNSEGLPASLFSTEHYGDAGRSGMLHHGSHTE